MKKKTRNIILGIVFVVLLISIIAYIGNKGLAVTSAPSGNYIQVPTFCYFECAPASKLIPSSITTFSGYAPTVKCPSNTDKCDIIIESSEQGFWSSLLGSRRIQYQTCDNNGCSSVVNTDAGYWQNSGGKPTVKISNLISTEWVNIHYQKPSLIPFMWADTSGADYYANYNPFILWKTGSLCGGRTEYSSVSAGCTFGLTDRNKLLDGVSNLLGVTIKQDSSVSTNDYTLEPYKTRNFVDGFVPMAVDNVKFVSINGQQGYCLNKNVYKIATVTTNSGTYNIVNPNYNQIISSVNCCPGDTEPTRKCDSNFQWQTLSGSQCSAFNPCAGTNPFPSGVPKQLVFYSCDNGNCKPHTQAVECTSDSDCLGNSKGSTCDTLSYTCSNIAKPIVACPAVCNVDSDCGVCSDVLKTTNYDFTCQSTKCVGKQKAGTETCGSCDAYALNKLVGSFWASKSCTPSLLQGWLTCGGSLIKLFLVPISFLLILIFGLNSLSKFKEKYMKVTVVISTIIFAVSVAWLIFNIFWLGIILGIIWIILSLIIKFLPLFL